MILLVFVNLKLLAQYQGIVNTNSTDVVITQNGEWYVVEISGCQMETKEGFPRLPIKSINIAIPETYQVVVSLCGKIKDKHEYAKQIYHTYDGLCNEILWRPMY